LVEPLSVTHHAALVLPDLAIAADCVLAADDDVRASPLPTV
jgi:hypothetical protein